MRKNEKQELCTSIQEWRRKFHISSMESMTLKEFYAIHSDMDKWVLLLAEEALGDKR